MNSHDEWIEQIRHLQKSAKTVAKSATWALQEFFPGDPIFSGPVVQADIMYAGFTSADVRFRNLLGNIASSESTTIGAFTWGTPVEKFVAWARDVVETPRPACRKGPASSKKSEHTRGHSNASQRSNGSRRSRANSSASNKSDSSRASQGSEFDMDKEPEGDWWYGVGVGVKLGTSYFIRTRAALNNRTS